jgi:biotin-dependent carboxylase-like uncharacterized protein
VITVLRAPPFATVQDLGRSGHLDAAVPRAGALDRFALAVGNLLVGNQRSAAGLEWGAGGGVVRFDRPATVALTGARATATLAGLPVEPGRTVRAAPGDMLEVERLDSGAWLYLAVSGGIDVPVMLGSRSTYLPARFGGLEGRVLRSGDRLPLGPGPARSGRATAAAQTAAVWTGPIRLLPGPDSGLLPPGAWDRMIGTEYTVSRAVSRMGYRLKGGALRISVVADRPSAPACIGTVQLPAGGEPIVLLCDGPTVGGYARIAVVATADLGQLAQRRPGEVVRFRPIELTEARQALREQRAFLDRLEGGA